MKGECEIHGFSNNNVYGKTENSTYFSFIEMGNLFEKEDFSASDGKIDNLLDPFNGWRLPTVAEWAVIFGNSRVGSTVNGVLNARWAAIRLTGVSYAGHSAPIGFLLFPDGKTISGKTLEYYNKVLECDAEEGDIYYFTSGVTTSELAEYLAQDCVFLPTSGLYDFSDTNEWFDGGEVGNFWCSDANDGKGSFAYFFSLPRDTVDRIVGADKDGLFLAVRLVKSVE